MIKFESVPLVWGITGNLGGGKTLTAASLAVQAFEKGWYVVSNVTLNLQNIRRYVGFDCSKLYTHFSFEDSEFDPFRLPVGSPRGSGGNKRVVVIMDECAEWVDQYSNAKDYRIQRFWSWLRHSSKRSQDVILIIQRLDYLNKVLRLLISRYVICDDFKVWRMPVLKARVWFLRAYCMQRVFNNHGQLIQGPFILRKSFAGQFYNTAECLNTVGATYLSEYKIPDTTPQWPLQYYITIYIISFIFLLLSFIYYKNKSLSIFQIKQIQQELNEQSANTSPPASAAGGCVADSPIT